MASLEVRWLQASVGETGRRIASLITDAKRAHMVEEAADLQVAEDALERVLLALAAKEKANG